MTIEVQHGYGADEAGALAELARDGFVAAVKDYAPDRTEPHVHEYDICLHVLEGEFRVGDVGSGTVHDCPPGAKLFVAAGTEHYEEHGALRMVVGQRTRG